MVAIRVVVVSFVFTGLACWYGTPAPPPPSIAVKETEIPRPVRAKASASESEPEVESVPGPASAAVPGGGRTGRVRNVGGPRASATASGFEIASLIGSVATPVVHGNAVIFSGGYGSRALHAVERTNGRTIWSLALSDNGPSNAVCEGNTCVINTESCTIFAVAADTGALRWSFWLGDPMTSAPTIANGRVFTAYPSRGSVGGKPIPAGATHVLAAFDLVTGAAVWSTWIDGDVMSAPVAVGTHLYVTTFSGTIVKLDQATGQVQETVSANASSAPVITARGQMIYSTVDDSTGVRREALVRWDAGAAKPMWTTTPKRADYLALRVQSTSQYATTAARQDAGNGFSTPPASANADRASSMVGVRSIVGMQMFQGSRGVHLTDRRVTTMGDEVIATDLATGRELWSYKLSGNLTQMGGSLATAPIAAGGSILFGTLAGEVVRLDAKSGKQLASYSVGHPIRSQPVVADGWIYVGTDDGRLVAINTRDTQLTGWSTWGGNAQRTAIP